MSSQPTLQSEVGLHLHGGRAGGVEQGQQGDVTSGGDQLLRCLERHHAPKRDGDQDQWPVGPDPVDLGHVLGGDAGNRRRPLGSEVGIVRRLTQPVHRLVVAEPGRQRPEVRTIDTEDVDGEDRNPAAVRLDRNEESTGVETVGCRLVGGRPGRFNDSNQTTRGRGSIESGHGDPSTELLLDGQQQLDRRERVPAMVEEGVVEPELGPAEGFGEQPDHGALGPGGRHVVADRRPLGRALRLERSLELGHGLTVDLPVGRLRKIGSKPIDRRPPQRRKGGGGHVPQVGFPHGTVRRRSRRFGSAIDGDPGDETLTGGCGDHREPHTGHGTQDPFDLLRLDPDTAEVELVVDPAQVLHHTVHDGHPVTGCIGRAELLGHPGATEHQLARHFRRTHGTVGSAHLQPGAGDGDTDRHRVVTEAHVVAGGPHGGLGRPVLVGQPRQREMMVVLLDETGRASLTGHDHLARPLLTVADGAQPTPTLHRSHHGLIEGRHHERVRDAPVDEQVGDGVDVVDLVVGGQHQRAALGQRPEDPGHARVEGRARHHEVAEVRQRSREPSIGDPVASTP